MTEKLRTWNHRGYVRHIWKKKAKRIFHIQVK